MPPAGSAIRVNLRDTASGKEFYRTLRRSRVRDDGDTRTERPGMQGDGEVSALSERVARYRALARSARDDHARQAILGLADKLERLMVGDGRAPDQSPTHW